MNITIEEAKQIVNNPSDHKYKYWNAWQVLIDTGEVYNMSKRHIMWAQAYIKAGYCLPKNEDGQKMSEDDKKTS